MAVTTTLRKLLLAIPILAMYSMIAFSAGLEIVPISGNFTDVYLLKNDLNLQIKFFNPENYQFTESELYINVYDCNGNLIYKDVLPVKVECGLNIYNYKLSGSVLVNGLNSCGKSGSVRLEALLVVYGNDAGKTEYSATVKYDIVKVDKNLKVSILNKQNYASGYIRANGLPVDVSITLPVLGYEKLRGTMLIQLTSTNGRIVYQDSRDIVLYNGNRLEKLTLYLQDVKNGEYTLRVKVNVYLPDGSVLSGEDAYNFVISDSVNGVVEIRGISPDFSVMKYIDNTRTYKVEVRLYNPMNAMRNVEADLYVYDQYGNVVVSQSSQGFVDALSEGTISVSLPALILTPGNYRVELVIKLENQEIYRNSWDVVVNRYAIQPVRVLKASYYPYDVKPGDYVEFTLELENRLPENIVLNGRIYSKEMNIMQTLSSIELQPNEVRTLKVIVKIPEGLQYGVYPIDFVFTKDGAEVKYTYNLLVNGTKPSYPEIMASLAGYKKLKVGENNTVTLLIKANTTRIYKLVVQAYAENADVYPEETEVTVGGTYTEQVKLNVVPYGNNVTLTVVLVDKETGKVLQTLSESYMGEGKVSTLALPRIPLIYVVYGVLAIVIIAIIIAILSSVRKKGKEKPEE